MAERVLGRLRLVLVVWSALALSMVTGCTVTRVNTSTAPPLVPTYAVDVDLPSVELDRFTAAGRLDRSLRVTTTSPDMRTTFGYHGDSSRGIRWAQGSLPSKMGIERELFAVGTSSATAHVQIHGYRMGR
jgi:hypothetical protein